jgi:beta-glucanase (GH16 family)
MNASQSQPSPVGPKGQWQLSFADEFNGDSLDQTKWNVLYPSGGLKGTELEQYEPYGVTVSNGALHLTAQLFDSAHIKKDPNHPYTSGMVASWDKVVVNPGSVIEARLRVPFGKGMWPAFWLRPQDGTWPPEIDVVEVLGSSSSIWRQAVHWKSNGVTQSQGFQENGVDSSAWHTVTVQWDLTQVIWFIDGVQQGIVQDPDQVPHVPMYLVADLAIGGGWEVNPDSTTHFPATLDVDYIRVWVRP